jgi:hypothetical protein
MQKVININIGGRIIKIEDGALQIQLAYIKTLHYYFINEEGCYEIINDIENRIAELMQAIINKQNAAINETDIKNIIRQMGTAAEFKELDTDDWDMPVTSPEYRNAGNDTGTIKSFYSLIENGPAYLDGFKLCCN